MNKGLEDIKYDYEMCVCTIEDALYAAYELGTKKFTTIEALLEDLNSDCDEDCPGCPDCSDNF